MQLNTWRTALNTVQIIISVWWMTLFDFSKKIEHGSYTHWHSPTSVISIQSTIPVLTQVVHPWRCENCRVIQQQFWMKECDIFRGQNILWPSYVFSQAQGVKTSQIPGCTPLLRPNRLSDQQITKLDWSLDKNHANKWSKNRFNTWITTKHEVISSKRKFWSPRDFFKKKKPAVL